LTAPARGGALEIAAGGDVTLGGRADVGATSGGGGGYVHVDSSGFVGISGVVRTRGTYDPAFVGLLSIDACRIAMQSGGQLLNTVSGGGNRLIAHESMRLFAGSVVNAGGGDNIFTYRSADKEPFIEGSVVPSAQLVLDETLGGCPVCGNEEVDETETCDDGNTAAGDGCSGDCQIE